MNLGRWIWTFVAVALAVAGAPGCSSSSANDSSGSGGQAPTRAQAMDALGAVLFNSMATLYNENFVGQSAGAIDKQSSCPVSGTVHFTGSLAVSQLASGSASTAPDLTLSMSNCGATWSGGLVTYDTAGASSLSYKGSWVNDSSGAVTQESATFSGTASLTGQVTVTTGTGSQSVAVNEPDCQFSITYTQNNSTWTESGVVCGVSTNHSGTK